MISHDEASPAAAPAHETRVDYGECPACGALTLPVLPMAPCGHGDSPIVRPLTAPGVVYSWTRTAAPVPTVIAMVDFFDGALRAAAPLTGAATIAIGDRVIAAAGATTPLTFLPIEGARP